MSYGSWAICGPSMQLISVQHRVMAIPGVQEGKGGGVPIFNGTLEDWCRHWKGKFTVHPVGAYITI